MPYIFVRSAIEEASPPNDCWNVRVTGLKEADILELEDVGPRFRCDNYTISYNEHPCIILNALEILDYKIITCTSYKNPSDNNVAEFMWTMRKEFSYPRPSDI